MVRIESIELYIKHDNSVRIGEHNCQNSKSQIEFVGPSQTYEYIFLYQCCRRDIMTKNYFCFEYIHESCKLNFDFTSGDSEIPLKYPKTNIFCHVMNSAINQLFKMNSFHIDLIILFLSFSIQGLDLIVV